MVFLPEQLGINSIKTSIFGGFLLGFNPSSRSPLMIRKYTKRLAKIEFVKNSVTLITGTVVAQVFPILLQPFLRRLFEPSDFGVLALYLTLLSIFYSFATLKYDSTVMLPQKDEYAANLVAGSVFISLLISILLFLLFFFFNEQIIRLLSLPEIMRFWLLVLPVSIFLFSSSQVFNYWLIRKKAFKSSSLNKVYRRGAEGVSQVGLGVTFSNSGLVIGNILGDLMNFVSSYYQAVKRGFDRKFIQKVKIIALLKRYSSFPKYNALPALLDTISLSIPVILLNKFYGGEVTGYFDLSRMFMALPLALISVSISQVLFQDISVRIREKVTIEDVLKRIIKILGVAAVLIVVIGMLFSVPLFTLVFGEKWEVSGVMTTILIPAYGLRFIVTPLTIAFNALEKIFWSSLWQFIYFIMICSLFFLEGLSVKEFLYVYLLIDFIAYILYFILLRWQVRDYEKNRVLNA